MALIACSECGKQISDKAAACPSCGNPIGATPSTAPIPVSLDGQVVTTQQTGKVWKAISLVGALIMALSVAACAAVLANPFQGIVWFFIGMCVFLGGRAGAWWSHG